ncbi:MAG: hypothetical protein V5A61_15550 [Haloarculaceae archaeon]
MSGRTRRTFLALGAAGLGATAGCLGLPAGPTGGITDWRRRRSAVPEVPRPAEPTDAQVRALRAFIDARVTAAEPLFADVSRAELGDDQYRRCAAGVSSIRRFLAESAADPASMDYGFARSRVNYVGYALGFLRSWHGHETPAGALDRARSARDAVADAAAAMPRDCAEPGRFLARVGWAERKLALARLAVDEYDDPPEPRTDGTPTETAKRVGRHYEQAARANWWARAARYHARAYTDGRPPGARPFGAALERNRSALRSAVDDAMPGRDAAERLAESRDSEVVATYLRRAGNPLGKIREQSRYATDHAERGIGAYAAVEAARARCHLRGYRRVVEGVDADELRDGVDPAALFEAKRRVVRRVRDGLSDPDPLVGWLVDEPARLLYAGEGYLEPDTIVDDRTNARAICLSFYRHALGYAEAVPGVARRLERRG